MGQIVRFELDEQETPAPQTQVQLPASSPINLTDEEERMSRDSNAEIRQKAHQVLESLMRGNERFRKVCQRSLFSAAAHAHFTSARGDNHASNLCVGRGSQACKNPGEGWVS